MLPLDKSQIPVIFKKARAAEIAGDLQKAIGGYESILKIDGSNAPAHFQLGQVYFKQKQLAAAIRHLDRAATIHPREPAIWKLFGRSVADLGDPAQEREFLAKVKKARLDRKLLMQLQSRFRGSRKITATPLGGVPAGDVKRAIGLVQSGRFAEAAIYARKLRRQFPNVAIVADILANAQAAIGEPKNAEKNFRAAQKLDPNYAETRSNFGQFLIEQERFVEAIDELKLALNLAPEMVMAMDLLGIAYGRNQDGRRAAIIFRKALEHEPRNTKLLVQLGQQLIGESRSEESLEVLTKARELGADEVTCLVWIARALSTLDRESEAMELLDRAAGISPDHPEVLFARALLFQKIGQFDDARKAYRRAIGISPNSGGLYQTFLVSEKLSADDPLIEQMEVAISGTDISDSSRINFGFALAKAMEDTGQYDRVFAYLKPANDLMRQSFPFNFDRLKAQSRDLMSTMEKVDFTATDPKGCSSYAPIFVTGLPRSGTTLVEQIVSSHSAVTGGGELGFARRAWGGLLFDPQGRARSWNDLDHEMIVQAGLDVEKRMGSRFGSSDRVTDKSVQSYSMMGPIRASLPNARFIVTKRDPRDNLVSMYKNVFAPGKHLQSYNLRDLARYYRLFEEIIDFWRKKMPGWFHEIQYEDLIADPETEARKLIAACGLEWEEQCLSFYENKRRVDTLSVHQVRQPIYSSSMQAWRRYESELTEMLEELGGEYAPGN